MNMLSYKIRKATTGVPPYPCLLLLHGYGSNADDLFSFVDFLPEKLTIISLEAPLMTPFGGKAWYSIHFDAAQDKWSDLKEAEKSLYTIIRQLDYFIKEYDLNPIDIGLMGFSQGAILSWSLLLDHPEQFRRAICMSGYINTQLLSKNIDEYQNILAYASHGTNDQTIPYQWSETSVNKLRLNNPKISFNSYPDGHNVSPENLRDLLLWISKTNLD